MRSETYLQTQQTNCPLLPSPHRGSAGRGVTKRKVTDTSRAFRRYYSPESLVVSFSLMRTR